MIKRIMRSIYEEQWHEETQRNENEREAKSRRKDCGRKLKETIIKMNIYNEKHIMKNKISRMIQRMNEE